jgi:ribosomal protein S27E
VLNHSVTIGNLTADTTYHFRVVSTDPSANPSLPSVDMTFTTLEAGGGGGGGGGGAKPVATKEFPWPWVVLAIIIVVGLAAGIYVATRKPPVQPAGPSHQPPKPPETEVMEVEAAAPETGAGEEVLESLPMEETSPRAQPAQPRAPPSQQQWPQPIMAATMAGTAGMAAQAAAPAPSPEIDWGAPLAGAPPARTPVKHIRCPVCKTRIPIFEDVEHEIKCPVCGKKGPYKPKGGQQGSEAAPQKTGEAPAAQPPGAPMFVHAPEPSSQPALDALVKGPRQPPTPVIAPVSRPPSPRSQPQSQPQEQPTRRTRCSNCGSPVPIYGNTFPIRVTCPNCGRSGTYNGPKR